MISSGGKVSEAGPGGAPETYSFRVKQRTSDADERGGRGENLTIELGWRSANVAQIIRCCGGWILFQLGGKKKEKGTSVIHIRTGREGRPALSWGELRGERPLRRNTTLGSKGGGNWNEHSTKPRKR